MGETKVYTHKVRKSKIMFQKSYISMIYFFYMWHRYLVFVIKPVNFGQRTREQTYRETWCSLEITL